MTLKSKIYWYRFHVGECPVCGKDQTWKERVYEPKPKSASKRYIHLPDQVTYCGCMSRE